MRRLWAVRSLCLTASRGCEFLRAREASEPTGGTGGSNCSFGAPTNDCESARWRWWTRRDRTLIKRFSKLVMARDFWTQAVRHQWVGSFAVSPRVPSSDLISTAVVETFWRRPDRRLAIAALRSPHDQGCSGRARRCATARRRRASRARRGIAREPRWSRGTFASASRDRRSGSTTRSRGRRP